MALYNLKSAEGDLYRMTKFDSDMNVESSYLVSDEACECPQFVNRDKRCRHQKMLKHFLRGPTIRLDTGWLYDYDNDAWFALNHDGQEAVEAEPPKPIQPTPPPKSTGLRRP
jgi:hypothetical protein